ncbi:MAG: FG-GAP-like repeat-containing protein [Polyangiales bacterium]
MRASFRENPWTRALAALCLMLVGAFALPACLPPGPGASPCGEGQEFRPPLACVAANSCNAVAISAGGTHTCAIVGPQTMCRTATGVVPPDSSGACTGGGELIQVGNEIRCWGDNTLGQLGDGTTTNRNSPTAVREPPLQSGEVAQVRQYLQVVAGGLHTCALLVGGAVECWGYNESGQLGNGQSGNRRPNATPVRVMGLTGVVEITAGGFHTCARLTDGSVRCWGSNARGQLGNDRTDNSAMPVPVTGLTNAVEITAGGEHTCARLSSGEVQCWGGNSDGQLGNGSSGFGRRGATPVAVRASAMGTDNLTGVAGIAAGWVHTCARLNTGEVRCWGSNSSGALGNNSTTSSTTPVPVTGLTGATQIALGVGHTCARLNTGEIRCWGLNGRGQLGDRTFENPRLTPTNGALCCPAGRESCASGCFNLQTDNANCGACGNACAAGTQCTAGRCLPATACSTCLYGACTAAVNACSADATCLAWLRCHAACVDDTCRAACMNASTTLATAVTSCQATRCVGACHGRRLAAGDAHTCAIRRNASNTADELVCWGSGESGQLGLPQGSRRDGCTGVALSDVVEVATGDSHTCARQGTGDVWCWGANDSRQLGDPGGDSLTPRQVPGIHGAVEVSAGGRHTCARLGTGDVYCWGSNFAGQAGQMTDRSGVPPQQVTGLTGVVKISAGTLFSCARLSTGTVWCWGSNNAGQLGDGTQDANPTPVQVSGITNAVEISAGGAHACARLSTGAVWCWGANQRGQIGASMVTESRRPVQVPGITDAVEISAGGSHTCARLGNGSVWCWGSNYDAQLGDGTTDNSSVPVQVSGITGAVEISAGAGHTCARLADGDVHCWGRNRDRQLGVPSATSESATPVRSVCVRGCATNGPIVDMTTTPPRRASATCALACVDTQTNAAHCGACDNACTDGRTCVAGRCVAPMSCTAPLAPCGSGTAAGCFNLQSDRNNCGTCGRACPAGQVCVGGACAEARATQIAAGYDHTCEVITGGAVRCWGLDDEGQRGDGTTVSSAVCSGPETIPGSPQNPAVEVAAGGHHTCARLQNGEVRCWGRGRDGQLGNGSTGDSETPVAVRASAMGMDNLTNVVEIAAGVVHTCARLQNGEVRCWGRGRDGQLGNGSAGDSETPVAVRASAMGMDNLTNVVEIAAGRHHTCARLQNGDVRCWGDNDGGQLGDGTQENRSTPVTAICTGATNCTMGETPCGTGCCGTDETCMDNTTCVTSMPSCTPGLTSCSVGGCVDLMTDPMYCGTCTHSCTTGWSCVTGECVPPPAACTMDADCPSEQTCTSNRCVPRPTGCTTAMDCAPGQGCCSGACANLATDAANCGTCGNVCAMGRTCMAGSCSSAACMAPRPTMCGMTCVDTLTSTAHCGGCSTSCSEPTNGAATCSMGTCGFTCNAGFARCGMACVDTQSDDRNCGTCGTVCPPTQSCSAGSCTLTCASGTTNCSGTCVNTLSNAAHCGGCNRACSTGQSCCNGMCAATTTVTNCGMCGVACTPPTNGVAACTSGACAIGSCNAGFANCDSNATNGCETTLGTPGNCASCGNACPVPTNGAATCASGACGFTCNAGFARCGTACVNTQNDNANCGTCGTVCPSGQVCSSGACAVSCATGLTNCSGDCADLTRDPANCGACGSPCTPLTGGMAVCASSMCTRTCPAGTHVVGTACVGDGGPKPVSPISLGDVTQLRPAFRWINPTNANGALIEVCNDRACASIAQTIMAPASGAVATTTVVATTALTGARTYYWRVRAMVGAVADTGNNSPVWLFHTPRSNRGAVQTSVRPHLDVNGDGLDDLAVAAPNASAGAGRVDVFLGSGSGLSTSVHRSLTGAAGAAFGTRVSSAGDVNGDGFGDLVVGAPGAASGNGTVSLYLGGASGLSATASFTATGTAGAALGTTVAGLGDVDLDGYGDLAAGAPGANANEGLARWYRGAATVTSLTAATLTGSGGANAQFGLTLAGVGDFNGDGFADLLVGEPDYNGGQGRLHSFRGSATGLPATATARVDGGTVGDRFTIGLAGAGDVNADGYSDAVSSAPFALGGDVGGFNVFLGGAGGFTNPSVPSGNSTRAGWGRVLAGAGDVNGNGRDDVLVAAPFLDSNRGRVYIIDGDALVAAGFFTFPPRIFEQSGDAQYASLGASLAGLGDTNGDGFSDVAFGAPGENSDSLGAVYVLRGATTVPATASAFMISMAGGDRYGAAIGGLDAVVPNAPPTCATGLSRCGAACVDASSNTSNCGGCGRACMSGQMCVGGACTIVARCPTGQTDCTPAAMTATCRDLQADVSNCGACSRVCAAPTGGAATCSSGTCGQTCPSGQMVCGSACAALGGACSAGVGACLRSGTIACTAGSAACNAVAGSPGTETCNNVDDNCDGTVDNGATCPTGQSCVSGMCMGATCGSGTTACGSECCTSAQTCAGARCRVLVLASAGETSFLGTTTGAAPFFSGPLTSACPAGMLLTELDGLGPSPFPGGPVGFSSVWATCMNASLNATPGVSLTGSVSTSSSAFGRGVTGVGFPFITACPSGQAAIGISIQTDVSPWGDTVPVGLQLRCAPIAVSAMGAGYVVGRGTVTDSPLAGTSGTPVAPAYCVDAGAGTNRFASGVRGYVYDNPMSPMQPATVEGIALTCASATVSP